MSDAWALNTYEACDIRCSYCITQAQGISTPRRPASTMAADVAAALDELGEPRRMVVGCYADAYPSPEPELRVTRAALEVLVERGLDFRLVTKGTAVELDADLFHHPATSIQISVTTHDAEAAAGLEPGAAPPAQRLAVAHRLAQQGVQVIIQISPWTPGITDVAALLELVPRRVRVQVVPLRLPSYLTRARRTLQLTQLQVNEAYHREFDRVGSDPRVHWARPPRPDGAPPHIVHNLGSHAPEDWSPAPIAPDPGSPQW